jgi:hypothetical protein
MKTGHKLATLALSSTATAALLVAAQPAQAAADFVTIKNLGNGLCLQPSGGSTDDGAAVVQQGCDKTSIQNWLPLANSSTQFRFINQATGKCLDARGGAANGTPIQQFACSGISNEKWGWTIGFNTGVPSQIVSNVSGSSSHCVTVPASPGVAVQLQRCVNSAAQNWFLGAP